MTPERTWEFSLEITRPSLTVVMSTGVEIGCLLAAYFGHLTGIRLPANRQGGYHTSAYNGQATGSFRYVKWKSTTSKTRQWVCFYFYIPPYNNMHSSE